MKAGDRKSAREGNARERLLKAGTALFAEKGYASTSVREIVEQAGVTKPVLYYYFKNKEGIFRAILQGAEEKQELLLAQVRDEPGSVLTRPSWLFRTSYEIVLANPDLLKLIHNLDPQARFYNGIAKTPYFRDWEAKARAGDARAAELVQRYYSPPEFELFDVTRDPLEQENLAGDRRYAPVMNELKAQLAAWMKDQGDLGHATEQFAHIVCIERQQATEGVG